VRIFASDGKLTVNIVTCRPIYVQRPKYTHTIENLLQEVFSVWSVPCPLLGNGSLNARNSRKSIARQRRGKQALSTIQAAFSVGSVRSHYKRVEFRSW
jgi:hypothetical protein